MFSTLYTPLLLIIFFGKILVSSGLSHLVAQDLSKPNALVFYEGRELTKRRCLFKEHFSQETVCIFW